MRSLPALGLLPLLAACATGPGKGAAFDPELVALLRPEHEIGGVKVRTDARGRVTKMSVYHAEESEIPLWARSMAAEKWPASKLRSYETEWYAEYGRVYEIEVTTAEGKTCELSVTAAGEERYVECELEPTKLPPKIAATVARVLPAGEVEEAERKQGPEVDEVSLEVEVGTKTHYLRVRSDGKLLEHLLRVPTILEVPVR